MGRKGGVMEVRKSAQNDLREILDIHRLAFGEDEGETIAELVADLFRDETAEPLHSFVAVENDRIVGHVLYTRVSLDNYTDDLYAQILAPLAVHPDSQGKGVGQRLINKSLETLQAADVALVFVLGHPGFYPKCGFNPAGAQGLDAPHPILPEHADAWMVNDLKGNLVGTVSGTVRCSRVLNDPQYWQE